MHTCVYIHTYTHKYMHTHTYNYMHMKAPLKDALLLESSLDDTMYLSEDAILNTEPGG